MDDRSLEEEEFSGGRSIRRREISQQPEREIGLMEEGWVNVNGRSSSRFVSKDLNKRDGVPLSIRARIESTRAASHARIVALKVRRWELVGWCRCC